jgi:hypothetical protein
LGHAKGGLAWLTRGHTGYRVVYQIIDVARVDKNTDDEETSQPDGAAAFAVAVFFTFSPFFERFSQIRL